MRWRLSTGRPAHGHGIEFRSVVLLPCFRGSQEQLQDLRVSFGSPAGRAIEKQKHKHAAHETTQEMEGAGADTHGEDEEFAFGAKYGKWTRERALHWIDSSWFGHVFLRNGLSCF